MADAVRDLLMSVGFDGASAIKGLDGLNKKADKTKDAIKGIDEKTSSMGKQFETQMEGLDKGFRLWETNAGKFTSALEKKQRRVELLKDKSTLLGNEIDMTNNELNEATHKFGENSEAAQRLENQLLDLKIQQAQYNNELKKLSGFDWDRLDRLGDKCGKIGGVMSAAVTVPLTGIGIAGTKTFIELEDSFAGVEKTVDAADEEIQKLRGSLNDLVTKGGIPVDVKEMYGIAEAAGQLGIKTQNITGFSEVMAKLGTATNMASEQAATDLARFANIVQMPQDNFGRLGSTIVALGNNLATTESEITSMGLRLSGAGKQIGLTESEILGFAGGLSSVGIEAEAGGTAFSKVMIGMQNAVMNGGEELDIFAAATGRTADEFRQAFGRDAASTIIDFTEGLGQLQKEGFNTNTVLEELGFSDVRVSDALRRAANSGDVFREAIVLGNKAWEENNALNEEAEKKYEKNAAKLEVFKNKITLLKDTVGRDLEPAFSGLLSMGTQFVDWLSGLDEGTRKTIVGVAGAVASIGPAFLGLSMGIKAVKGIRDTITDLGKGMKLLKGAFSVGGKAIGLFASPVGIAVAAIGALIIAGVVLYKNWDRISAWFKSKFPGAFSAAESAVNGFTGFVSDNIGNIKDIFSGFSEFITGVFSGNLTQALSGLGNILKGAFAIVANIISGAASGIFNLIELIISPLQERFPLVFDIITGVLGVFKDTVNTVIGEAQLIFNGLIDFVKGAFTLNWELGWSGVKDIFGGIFGMLAGLVKAPMNAVISVINSAIGRINGIKVDIPSWVPGMGGQSLGFNIPTIPMLAKGTDFFKGGPALVGEEGPEIVNLNRGDTVTPFEKTKSLLAGLGRGREEQRQEYVENARASAPVEGVRQPVVGAMPKIDIKIDKIIVGGEITKDNSQNLKRQIKAMFREAWEQYWFELSVKYPNLTEC